MSNYIQAIDGQHNDGGNVEVKIDVDHNDDCIYCGEKCYRGQMCDEQQAGGFDNAEQLRRDEKNGLYGDKIDDAN